VREERAVPEISSKRGVKATSLIPALRVLKNSLLGGAALSALRIILSFLAAL
jgi:hypothetical protein